MSMADTGTDAHVLNSGAEHRRSPSPRQTRCAQRAFAVLAALGLGAVGTATPAAADSSSPAPPSLARGGADQGPGLDSTGDCKFGGKNIKSTPWSLQRVLLDELWSKATGKGVTVAVIDTGVDKGNKQIRPALAPGGKDFVGKTTGTTDVNGHGTRVAGIIAAEEADKVPGWKGNETGFSGIAPDAKILPLRYTGSQEKQGNSETMSQAITYAVSQKADIINISSDTADKKSNPTLEAAVRKAVDAGILVVAAAGNDGANGKLENTYPGAYDGVLAVGASDRNNERAFFSQAGNFVDIAAPGVGMVSTVPKGGQCPADGTSFSAPYVAGVAALMMDRYEDWSAEDIVARMQQTANRPGAADDPQLGWGVVDPVAALSDDDPPQNEPRADQRQQRGRVTPMSLTVGESDTERTQRISVYVLAAGTVLTLLIGGTAVAVRDHRRKHAATANGAADTTSSSTH